MTAFLEHKAFEWVSLHFLINYQMRKCRDLSLHAEFLFILRWTPKETFRKKKNLREPRSAQNDFYNIFFDKTKLSRNIHTRLDNLHRYIFQV